MFFVEGFQTINGEVKYKFDSNWQNKDHYRTEIAHILKFSNIGNLDIFSQSLWILK